jgi:hypothetical protein
MTAPAWDRTWTGLVEAMASLSDDALDRLLDDLTDCEAEALADGYDAEQAAVADAEAIVLDAAAFQDGTDEGERHDDR